MWSTCTDISTYHQTLYPHTLTHNISLFSRHLHCYSGPSLTSRSGKLQMQKLKSHPLRTHCHLKTWSRSVYIYTCYVYCQGFLPCLFLPFRSIHLHFFQNLSWLFLYWLWLTHGSCVGPQKKIGHPARGRFPCWVPAEYKKAKKKHDLWYDNL